MIGVRPATTADLDALSWLERSIFSLDAWSPRSVEQELQAMSPDRIVLVAAEAASSENNPVSDDAAVAEAFGVVGYAVLAVAGETSDLRRIAVADDYQRRGVATSLMAELLTRAHERGCKRVLLEVSAANEAALSLYGRHGFVEIARRRRYYDDGTDAIVMQLALDGEVAP